MGREPTQPLLPEVQQLIRERLVEEQMKPADLARRANVNRSSISRLLNTRHRQENVSVRVLKAIAEVLNIAHDVVIEQYELDLEITEEFIEAARTALTTELLRLKDSLGRVRATRITAMVGVEIYGTAHEKQVYERIFAIA